MRLCSEVSLFARLLSSALIILSSLSNQKSDEELEHSVHNVYDAFGRCYVKIRRDKNKMPFAFVQFEVRPNL